MLSILQFSLIHEVSEARNFQNMYKLAFAAIAYAKEILKNKLSINIRILT